MGIHRTTKAGSGAARPGTRLLQGGLLLMLAMAPAQAGPVTITFNLLPGGIPSPLTAYSESGFDVSGANVSGSYLVPGISTSFVISQSETGGTLAVTRQGGGTFELASLDAFFNGPGDGTPSVPMQVGGWLGASFVGTELLSVTTSTSASIVSAVLAGKLIDRLDIILQAERVGTTTNFRYAALDAITLNVPDSAIPEPGSLALGGLGLAGLLIFRLRRKA